jgi:hypothetical protein
MNIDTNKEQYTQMYAEQLGHTLECFYETVNDIHKTDIISLDLFESILVNRLSQKDCKCIKRTIH